MKKLDLCLKHRLANERVAVDEKIIKKPTIMRIVQENHSINRTKKLLLIGFYKENMRNTLKETTSCFFEKSAYQIDFFNLGDCWCIPSCINLLDYDGIIFHYLVGYDLTIFPEMIKHMCPPLDAYNGVKVLLRQDEIVRTNASMLAQTVRKYGFHLILTICNEELQERIYQKSLIPNVRFMPYLTGYVSEKLKNLSYTSSRKRPIDIGYRVRRSKLSLGKLTYDKYIIAKKCIQYAAQKDLKVDISCEPQDTKMGDAWFDFLGNCKMTLGTESGGSIVDISGEAERTLARLTKENPNLADEQILEALQPFESDVWYNAISPRHFEAAACFTLQVLYEGEYQGIFKPFRHYLPLKKDWSNMDELMEIAMNPQKRKDIVECAYEEIVQNPIYSFDNFMRQFDGYLDAIFRERDLAK